MRKNSKFMTDEEFENTYDYHFTVITENPETPEGEEAKEIELCTGGKSRKLKI